MKNKNNVLSAFTSCVLILYISCTSPSNSNDSGDYKYIAKKASTPISIDGKATEDTWEATDEWYKLDQLWVGDTVPSSDVSGRFKLSWDNNFLYVLAEIEDDVLMDTHDGLELYWDDDCLEIFVDEDASGGNHQYNYNAFAYHIALDYKTADIGVDSLPLFLNDHVLSKRTQKGNKHIWECAVKLFDDSFDITANNTPVKLSENKIVGFALAYCDNDQSAQRESFLGSEIVQGEDKNRGWIDAGIFGKVKLSK